MKPGDGSHGGRGGICCIPALRSNVEGVAPGGEAVHSVFTHCRDTHLTYRAVGGTRWKMDRCCLFLCYFGFVQIDREGGGGGGRVG